MAFALAILFEGIFNPDNFAAYKLTVHGSKGGVAGLEVIVADKAIPLRHSRFGITHNFRGQDVSKCRKRLVKSLFVDLGIEAANEQVCAYFLCSFVLGGFVYFYGLSVKLDHVHYFDSIIGIVFTLELDKSVALVLT